MKKQLFLAVPLLLLLASCGDEKPFVSSGATKKSSSEGTSLVASSTNTVSSVTASSTSAAATSSSEQTSSSSASSSAAQSSSSAAQSSSSQASTPITFTTLTIGSADVPANNPSGYPEPGVSTIQGHQFYLSYVMQNNTQPLNSAGKKLTGVNTIQIQGESGSIYNVEEFYLKTLTIVMLDTTNTYNPAYATPSLYYGKEAHPLTDKLTGTYVQSVNADGYKIITATYTLTEATPYFTLLNDASTSTDTASPYRAVKGLSVTLN